MVGPLSTCLANENCLSPRLLHLMSSFNELKTQFKCALTFSRPKQMPPEIFKGLWQKKFLGLYTKMSKKSSSWVRHLFCAA